jgi:hypothetical protein
VVTKSDSRLSAVLRERPDGTFHADTGLAVDGVSS